MGDTFSPFFLPFLIPWLFFSLSKDWRFSYVIDMVGPTLRLSELKWKQGQVQAGAEFVETEEAGTILKLRSGLELR